MDETAVQGWPTALQCLTWSNDSQLAVGVGEHVAVFVSLPDVYLQNGN